MKATHFHLFATILLFLSASSVFSSSIEVAGEVAGEWTVDTVRVTGDLTVLSGETLVIHPGVRVEFLGHFRIIVRGTVLAIGTVTEIIDFTVADTTGFSDTLTSAGGWYGFYYEHLDPDTDSSLFSYCRFRYGKAITMNDTLGLYGGAFRIVEYHNVGFSHCVFEHNHAYRWGGAIFARYANISVMQCTFRANQCGRQDLPYGYGGALCFVHSNPLVIANAFEQNRSTGIGGGASFEFSDPVVRLNIFEDNYSGLGGGIGYLRTAPENSCANNLFLANEARFFGGAIACIAAHTRFVNNTITQNTSIYGGAFYCNDSAVPSNYNCLFYDNFAFEGVEVYIWDIRSAPNFYYCNVPGDTSDFSGSGGHEGYHGEYLFNTDTVVEFTGTAPYPFQLMQSSPMRDAGTPDTINLQLPQTDLAENPRIYNHRIDIGAFEWHPGPGIHDSHHSGNLLFLYPNPASSQVTIRYFIHKPSPVSVSIYNMDGQMVHQVITGVLPAGEHESIWNLRVNDQTSVVPAGNYLVNVTFGDQQASRMMIIDN